MAIKFERLAASKNQFLSGQAVTFGLWRVRVDLFASRFQYAVTENGTVDLVLENITSPRSEGRVGNIGRLTRRWKRGRLGVTGRIGRGGLGSTAVARTLARGISYLFAAMLDFLWIRHQ